MGSYQEETLNSERTGSHSEEQEQQETSKKSDVDTQGTLSN